MGLICCIFWFFLSHQTDIAKGRIIPHRPGLESDDGGRVTFGGRGMEGEKVRAARAHAIVVRKWNGWEGASEEL